MAGHHTKKHVLVLGLGCSGLAAAKLLLREQADVTVIDALRSETVLARSRTLRRGGARVLTGLRAFERARYAPKRGRARTVRMRYDLCVTSPGLASDHAWLRAIRAARTRVVSELELGASRCRWPMVAITGSNGKSTAVKLCAEALALDGKRVAIAGNYGIPLSEVVLADRDLDWMIVEVSSFQLEHVESFKPAVGVWLNLQPNHLDRHGSMTCYAQIKARLFARMDKGDTAVVPVSSMREMRTWVSQINPNADTLRWIGFGSDRAADCRVVRHRAVAVDGQRVPLAGTRFADPVMAETAAAIVAVVTACKADVRQVAAAARQFEPLPHRFQKIGTLNGVDFVNDSKSTTLSALQAALRRVPGSVRLIAGGRLKEKNTRFIKESLATSVKKFYGIGEDGIGLVEAWRDTIPSRVCGDVNRAVALAWRESKPGETILFSPGCASFDQFSSFEERGRCFMAAVQGLMKKYNNGSANKADKQ